MLIETEVVSLYPAYAQQTESGDLLSVHHNKPGVANNSAMVSSPQTEQSIKKEDAR